MKNINDTKEYHLPTSGQIIGEIFKVFDTRYDPHLTKEFQRFFCGQKIEEDNRQHIYELLADAIIEILPHPEVFDQAFLCPWGLKIQVIRAISEYADRWDFVRERVSHWQITSSRKKEILVTVFRLAIIDLALRFAAFRYLSKSPHLKRGMPMWMKKDGNVLFLRQLLDKCAGPNCKPINIAFEAGAAEIEKSARDWFVTGIKPSKEHIAGLADAFTKRIPETKREELLLEIRQHYVLKNLYHRIAGMIDNDQLTQLVGVLFHYSAALQEFFERDTLRVEENYSYFLLHCITGAGKLNYSPEHFKYLWERETDPEWRRDLVMVGRDWFPRIVQRNLRIRGATVVSRSDEWKYFPSASETISANVDYISAIFINQEVNGDMALWGGAGNEAYDWDRRTETELREAVQSHPNNPRMHLDLGVFLAHSSYQPEHPNEGLHECLKAVDLRPKWYRPRMEIAHILLRYKNYKGALEYLEQAVRELPYVPNKLAYTFGFAKMMNKDYIGSLDIFEKIIQKFPDHALALDNASYCCFQLGETVKGKSRAKRAQMYGISTTYDQYDVGGFKEKASLPLQTLCERVGCRQENCKGRNEVEEARDNLGKIINKS